jgi:excisionase family DNA binding protein
MTDTHLLTPDDAAAYLGALPVRTLERWRYAGTGPAFVRVGKHVRYRLADLDAWIAERRVDPQAA